RQGRTGPAALNTLPVDVPELIGFSLHLRLGSRATAAFAVVGVNEKPSKNETPRLASGASGSPPPEPPDSAKSKANGTPCPQVCGNHTRKFSTRSLITPTKEAVRALSSVGIRLSDCAESDYYRRSKG